MGNHFPTIRLDGGSLSRNILYSISARSNIKKSRESEPASANNLLSRRVRHPEKQNPPSSRRRQRWRKEKREARLFRRGKNSATWSPFRRPLREYLARVHQRAPVRACTCACACACTRSRRAHAHACAHTFLPACSRVQIGIEKSRSQLKLRTQKIRRDKIPIISCPRHRPLPSSPFLARAQPRGGDAREEGLPLQELNSIRH